MHMGRKENMMINYLKVSNKKLALIVNFGELKLNYKRIVLDKKRIEWEN